MCSEQVYLPTTCTRWGWGWWGAGGSRTGASSTVCLGCLCSPRFAGAFTLRQRMLNFVQNIQYYMMFEVMEPTWHILEKNLKSVSSDLTTVTLRLCSNQGPHIARSSERKVLGWVSG